MIQYRFVREKELLLEYAEFLDETEATAILTRDTIATAAEATIIARFFWRMVDDSLADDIEDWLERILNSLYAACCDAGFAAEWQAALPDD